MALNFNYPIVSADARTAAAAGARMQRFQAKNLEMPATEPRRMKTGKGLILHVEAHKDTRDVLKLLLSLTGYQVREAFNAKEALQLAAEQEFDLYLMGDVFPRGHNFELVKQIRSFNLHTPLILHSAQAYPADIRRGLAVRAQAYLVKPCEIDRLLGTIALYIGQSLAERV